jgi:hypothetical protein
MAFIPSYSQGAFITLCSTLDSQHMKKYYLDKYPADLDFSDDTGKTCLMSVCLNTTKDKEEVFDLVMARSSSQLQACEKTLGWNALFFAASVGNYYAADQLLKRKIQLIYDKQGKCAFNYTSSTGPICELFKQYIPPVTDSFVISSTSHITRIFIPSSPSSSPQQLTKEQQMEIRDHFLEFPPLGSNTAIIYVLENYGIQLTKESMDKFLEYIDKKRTKRQMAAMKTEPPITNFLTDPKVQQQLYDNFQENIKSMDNANAMDLTIAFAVTLGLSFIPTKDTLKYIFKLVEERKTQKTN